MSVFHGDKVDLPKRQDYTRRRNYWLL